MMGTPVQLKVDDFVYMGEEFAEGDVFNAPTEAYASFLCEQEKKATRVKESDCEPEKVGTMKRTLSNSSYDTKVMTPTQGGTPTLTKTKEVKTPSKKKTKESKKQ